MLTLLGICGALRAGSTNRLLLAEARRVFGEAEHVNGSIRMPLFDEDDEVANGFPPEAMALHGQIKAADAIVIATPEYNKSVPGGLKNALDWVSRVPGAAWRDKPVAIMSAADGRAGGDRSQFALRLCLTPFRPRLITGPEVMVADSRKAFDEGGRLKDERYVKTLTDLMQVVRAEAER